MIEPFIIGGAVGAITGLSAWHNRWSFKRLAFVSMVGAFSFVMLADILMGGIK